MASDNVCQFTDDNFEQEVIKSDKPVLVDFWAEWCMPCKMLAPTIDALAEKFVGRVKIGKVNTDDSRDVAAKMEITAIPTVILFNGGQVVHKFVGVTSEEDFSQELEKIAG